MGGATAGIAALTTEDSSTKGGTTSLPSDGPISAELGPPTTTSGRDSQPAIPREPSVTTDSGTYNTNKSRLDSEAFKTAPADKTTDPFEIISTPQWSTNAPLSSEASSGAIEPSIGADPTAGQKSFQKQQGADRPLEEPLGKHADAVIGGATKTENTQASGAPSDTYSRASATDHQSKSTGIGEEYVKSSGTAAEGGNFDASKPGAGKEAHRKCLTCFNLNLFII